MKNKICKRLIIQGITSYSIQGANFREKIEEFVKENLNNKSINVVGRISNLKNGEVEVVFCFSRKIDLDRLKGYLSKSKGVQSFRTYDYVSSQAFTDFRIERSDDLSDDLSEMVWERVYVSKMQPMH